MVDGLEKQKVLIVDDAPENIQTLMEALKDDYAITAATNGEKALKLAEGDNPPDLILLDIMMPGMDGYEVCRRLKDNDATRKIPVIFVTGKSDVDDETLGFKLGAADYITKPISPPITRERVRTHLALYDQNRVLEEKVKEQTRSTRMNDSSTFSGCLISKCVGSSITLGILGTFPVYPG